MPIFQQPSKVFVFLLFILGLGLSPACRKDNKPSPPVQQDPAYYSRQAFVVSINTDFILYDSSVKFTGLRDTLAAKGPFTNFVPDNNAFNQNSQGIYAYLGGNGLISNLQLPLNARNIFLSFLFPGVHYLKDLPVGRNQVFSSLAGIPAYVSKYNVRADSMVYTFNGVPVATPDFPASNGPIQVIDKAIPNVVMNATIDAYVKGAPELTWLAAALQRSGLDKVLAGSGPYTMLAPVNSAFRNSADPSLNSLDSILRADTAKLARILRYHILPDRNFLFDFNLVNKGVDTVRYPTLQNQQTITLLFKGPYGNKGNFFLGNGNWRSNGSGGNRVANPAGLYSLNYGASYIADRPTGNGVIHEIDRILIP